MQENETGKRLCAIIGEDPEELPFGYDEEYPTCIFMKQQIVSGMLEAMKQGVSGFISSLEQGVEMWSAEACDAIRRMGGGLSFIAVPLSENQADRWHPERRERYFDLIDRSDETCYPTETVTSEEYILDRISFLIVFGEPASGHAKTMLDGAKARGIPITHIGFSA